MDVIMPQMGESIAEGTLSRWLKAVGDEVKRDEPIFEISTDKVDAEIPAPAAGILAEILVQQGADGRGADGGGAAGDGQGGVCGGRGSAGGAPAGAPRLRCRCRCRLGGPPRKAKVARFPRLPRTNRPAAPTAPTPSGNGNSFEERVRTRSSPLVRKIAAEHGLEITAMQGSGIAGRVTKKDLLPYLAGGAKQGTAAVARQLRRRRWRPCTRPPASSRTVPRPKRGTATSSSR